ncbi:MAG: flagellar biosynthetic protein FliR [Albidovulum sp.]
MTVFIEQAIATFGQAACAAFLVFLRVGAAVSLLPGFGEATIPTRVKLALALALTAVVAPAVAATVVPLAASPADLIPCLATETLSGLSIGIAVRLMSVALEVAGTIAAQFTSLSHLVGTRGEPMPAFSHLLILAGIALAMTAGFHTRITAVFILSYEAWPPGLFPGAELVKGWGVAHIARAFALAFGIAAPFVLAATIYNVALGAINRAMPQLMVAFVGAPALAVGALVLLSLAAPAGLALWMDGIDRLLDDLFGASA